VKTKRRDTGFAFGHKARGRGWEHTHAEGHEVDDEIEVIERHAGLAANPF
jgi:hypothetical protein